MREIVRAVDQAEDPTLWRDGAAAEHSRAAVSRNPAARCSPLFFINKPSFCGNKNAPSPTMRSGIMYGTAAMLDGMLDRVEEELGFSTTVVATGGMAQFIVPLCRREIRLGKWILLFRIAFYRSIICKNRGVVKAFCSFDRGYSAP